ncbi:MAG: TIGR02587 family membrane protein [Chthoniobacteraceae bacterium]
MVTPKTSDPHGWRTEGRDLMQGLASGAIVGIPLLYTMEMWFHGMKLSEWHLVGVLVATLLANIVFSLLSGFRESTTLSGAVMDSVTAVGIALLFSALVLWLVGQLHADEGLADALGKVIIEAAVVSIGISFANNQVRNRSRTGEDDEEQDKGDDSKEEKKPSPEEAGERQKKKDLQEAGAALAGSTLFALNIAPTEEVVMIASQLDPLRLLALLVAGVVFCYLILFASEFKEHEVHVPSLFQHPVSETILTCAISLTVAAILLLMVGERAALTDPMTTIGCIVVLGLPAIIGGAAGRLIT